MSDPRDEGRPREEPDEELPGDDLLGEDPLAEGGFDADGLQSSTGGGMGPESYPPEADEDYSGNGADRGPR